MMNSGLDALWERTKDRYPTLKDFDVIRDQSNTHHTLVTALGFGTIGCLFAVLPQTTYAEGWAAGVIGGLIGYVIREHLWLGRENAVAWWDGVMDFMVPASRLLALAVAIVWWPAMPVGIVLLAQGLLLCEALGYTVFRPPHSLFYGRDPR